MRVRRTGTRSIAAPRDVDNGRMVLPLAADLSARAVDADVPDMSRPGVEPSATSADLQLVQRMLAGPTASRAGLRRRPLQPVVVGRAMPAAPREVAGVVSTAKPSERGHTVLRTQWPDPKG
jgi:hypothetical protein